MAKALLFSLPSSSQFVSGSVHVDEEMRSEQRTRRPDSCLTPRTAGGHGRGQEIGGRGGEVAGSDRSEGYKVEGRNGRIRRDLGRMGDKEQQRGNIWSG